MKILHKNDLFVRVHDKFVYHIDVYLCWKNGCTLYNEHDITTDKPIKITKKLLCNKTKKDKLWFVRYIDLLGAPENYLINNGFRET